MSYFVSSGVVEIGSNYEENYKQTVLSGGKTINDTFTYFADQDVASGGVTIGTQLVAPNLPDTYVWTESQIVESGGIARNTLVSGRGSFQYVQGVASATVIAGDSAYQQVEGNGALAISSVVSSGGWISATSSGVVSDAIVCASGTIGAWTGATVQYAQVADGGSLQIYAGGVAEGTCVSSGGIEAIFSGGIASGDTVQSGGMLALLPGASTQGTMGDGSVVDATIIYAVSGRIISAFGSPISANISGGSLSAFVLSGGYMSGATIQGNATVDIHSGGSAGNLSAVGGEVVVDRGGCAVSTYINIGYEYVAGVTTGTMLANLGSQVVLSGGIASGTVVNVSHNPFMNTGQAVRSGGIAIGTTVWGGFAQQYVGGTAYGTILSAGADQIVDSGGIASDTQIFSGSVQTVNGSGAYAYESIAVSGATITAGQGWGESDTAGGTTVSALISGGTEVLTTSGTASATTLRAGGELIVSAYGRSIGADLTGGTEFVAQQGAAVDTITQDGGSLLVQSGATAFGGQVLANGLLSVESGASASGATISSGGVLAITSGGSTSGFVIESGARVYNAIQYVLPGAAVLSGAQVLQVLDVLGSGSAVQTTVLSGGLAFVQYGAQATSNVVMSGGEIIAQTGAAVDQTVLQGGMLAFDAPGDAVSVQSGAIAGNGTIAAIGTGRVTLSENLDAFTGTIALSGATLELAQPGTVSGGEIVFAPGTSGTLVLDGGTDPGAAIADFADGDAIDLAGLTYTDSVSAHVVGDPVLEITSGGLTRDLTLLGTYRDGDFHLADDRHGGTLVTLAEGTPCYCRGTLIATVRDGVAGETPVEALQIGDLVQTRTNGARPVRWIGRRSYSGLFASGNRDVMPVVFRTGSLGDGVPAHDLMVSPLHAMYLDDVLIPAVMLVNGRNIVQAQAMDEVAYFHVELETHDIIIANGALSETFIDDQSRGMFHNCNEFRALYPDSHPVEPRYCAPRLEEGVVVEGVRRRLADRATGHQTLPEAPLEGYLDSVTREAVIGWARDLAAPGPVRLAIRANGRVLGHVIADRPRPDVGGDVGFVFEVPGGLALKTRQVIEVHRADGTASLGHTPWVLDQPARAERHCAVVSGPAVALEGFVDRATRDRVSGWAWSPETPETPIALQIFDRGALMATTIANAHRADVEQTGRSLRCGFDLLFAEPLSPFVRHVIEVRRESDGASLGAPAIIEAADAFGPDVAQALTALVDGAQGRAQEEILSFLSGQITRISERRITGHGSLGIARERARRGLAPALACASPRVLVIDAVMPDGARDAGSCAVLSHMHGFQELGYAVDFVAADGGRDTLALDDVNVHGQAFGCTVEDVLRAHAGVFDVVYLHREAMATRYMALVRAHQPRARVMYAVADLHCLRVLRQAEIQERPELVAEARRLKWREFHAAAQADVVVTHSSAEAELLVSELPRACVRVVPWKPATSGRSREFTDRRDVLFLGNYGHAPNVDAAKWLVQTIMPHVWAKDPEIVCILAGAGMTGDIRDLACERVRAIGHAPDLDALFARVRVSVAPLRFGAGVKGKVLDSMAAGVPVAMTGCAAEGMALPAELDRHVCDDPAGLAMQIVHLHGDAGMWYAASDAGLAMTAERFGTDHVAEALRKALAPTGDAPGNTARTLGIAV